MRLFTSIDQKINKQSSQVGKRFDETCREIFQGRDIPRDAKKKINTQLSNYLAAVGKDARETTPGQYVLCFTKPGTSEQGLTTFAVCNSGEIKPLNNNESSRLFKALSPRITDFCENRVTDPSGLGIITDEGGHIVSAIEAAYLERTKELS